jgi:hypothetical protein
MTAEERRSRLWLVGVLVCGALLVGGVGWAFLTGSGMSPGEMLQGLVLSAILLFCLFLLALIPGSIAKAKGREMGPWVFYGMCFWLVALIHALLLRATPNANDERLAATGEFVRCPKCAEMVRRQAQVC